MVGFSWILSKDGESEDVAEREDMVVDVMVLKFRPGRMLCAATAICDLSKILLVSMRLIFSLAVIQWFVMIFLFQNF